MVTGGSGKVASPTKRDASGEERETKGKQKALTGPVRVKKKKL